MPIEIVDRSVHRLADQRAAGDGRHSAIQAPGLRATEIRLQILEEVASYPDPILDLRVAVVEICRRHRLTAHQVELVAEVQEGLAALRPELPLPGLGLPNDPPCLFRLVAADRDLLARKQPHARP